MKRRAYLYFVLTFVLGAVAGGVGVFLYAWYGGHWHRQFDRGYIVQHLSTELKLNAQQVSQLKGIIDESSRKYEELHHQVRPQFAALREQTNNQIRQILTPEQGRKFDQLVREWRQNMGRLRR